MQAQFWLTLLLFALVLVAVGWPLSAWLVRVASARFGQGSRLVQAVERPLWRIAGIDPAGGQRWPQYTFALLLFNAVGVLAVYLLQRVQAGLPLDPAGFGAVEQGSAFNTAVSFVTNTNWQGYTGEQTMAHLTQMLALTVQNFLSAATGLAVAFALTRGLARRGQDTPANSAESGVIGNFWVDVVRITLWVLIPICVVVALALVQQGSIQNLNGFTEVATLDSTAYDNPKVDAAGKPVLDAQGKPVMEHLTIRTQQVPGGPVASEEAIKELGTNGGGFFNANSAHPFENPTALTNFIEMLSILLLPTAIVLAFGRMVGDTRQGWTILATMAVVLVAFMAMAFYAELTPNPHLTTAGVASDLGNLEGKETRFGVVASTMFAAITTATSCGAVNAMHDSFMPLGGAVPMSLILLGEVIFGGVGTGLYTMLVYVLTAVFIAGLMIGRTPEYLGKRIESYDMKMVSIAILLTPIVVLSGAALSVALEAGRAGISNPGPHGLSQILYAWGSSTHNNGSAFAGLNANTRFYNIGLAVAMWLGRFGTIIPVLALAGNMALKKRSDAVTGKMPTHGALFVGLLIGTVFLIGALTYVPALALGPAAEHLQLFSKAAQ
ncbi:MAG TPA: potassium-transporting ATPase subunit KdpA [Burkholderiaceae bacterium]|nr:potassium-transporting ATPase subunit KdpA [Burkholderiaceae bacterium]